MRLTALRGNTLTKANNEKNHELFRRQRRPALVLAPLRVASSTWPDEAKKWAHLRNVEVSAVVGTPEERRAALKRPATIYATNYDNLPWLVEHFGDRWPFRKVVADESTKLKSFRLKQGGKRAHSLGRVAHCKIDRFIELTGTPSPNGLQDLWGQAWFLDKGVRLGRSFEAFKARWFQSI
ncbi:SNF2-related protein [Noviherbaspirillum cavernae]|uniref:SNF2-related protein n=1 Tax=Noviherbaspirillum cavernae TaxID=2320862 RepID=UPI0030F45E11